MSKNHCHMRFKIVFLSLLATTAVLLNGCTPDNKNASLGAPPNATFTVSPLSGKANYYVAAASGSGIFQYYWNRGDGSASALGGANDTIFYPLAGNYRVTLTAFGHGGYDSVTQIVQVDSNAPQVNVLVNPSLTTDSGWTVLNVGGTQTTIAFTPQGLNLSNAPGSSTNGGVYQAVQVKAGVVYTFSATVMTPGSSGTWVEFYFGTTTPTQGSDYTNNKLWSLNTFAGCGSGPESGNIVQLNCAGSGASTGQITFLQNETIYFVIKAGSYQGTLGAGGVTVSNVVLDMPPQ
jgi:PKD repeat protein